jgi:hypothetical protein
MAYRRNELNRAGSALRINQVMLLASIFLKNRFRRREAHLYAGEFQPPPFAGQSVSDQPPGFRLVWVAAFSAISVFAYHHSFLTFRYLKVGNCDAHRGHTPWRQAYSVSPYKSTVG